jgi:hypothetical protein
MAAPTPRFYNVTAQGNGLIADLTTNLANPGPKASAITSFWDFGPDQAGTFDVKCLAMGFEGNTASSVRFWLYDTIADVNGTPNAEQYDDASPWTFRVRVSKTFIDPASFTDVQIAAGPWGDLPMGQTATGFDLFNAVLGLNPGNDGTTNFLVNSSQFTSPQVKLVNAFIYVAIKPEILALDGEHLNWAFRAAGVYP